MENTQEQSSTTELWGVTVKELINSDFCKVYEVEDTPFNVRHFINDDGTTKEVVICIGDKAIAKKNCIEAAMHAIRTKDWQLILVGAWVYGNKMDTIKSNKED